jgi:hypothetical protein
VSWLDPLTSALDNAGSPVEFFLRDDDAGWADRRLVALLDACAERSLPVDLAVIPAALHPALAGALCDRIESAPALLGLHQHGLTHANHEPSGRKCEFGPARDRAAQRRDIEAGRERLAALLGPHVDPIFTPPWNRCTRDTGSCLAALGFVALSRESRGEPLAVDGLQELPVAVDWFAHRKGERLTPAALGDRLARECARPGPVGVMFHHALMDAGELPRAGELLDLLEGHPSARVLPMRDLVRAGVQALPA